MPWSRAQPLARSQIWKVREGREWKRPDRGGGEGGKVRQLGVLRPVREDGGDRRRWRGGGRNSLIEFFVTFLS